MPDELALPRPAGPETIWFARRCCVVVHPDRRDVYAGGALVGSFGKRETAKRNMLLMTLADQPDVHLGKLARGFGLSSDAVRVMRRLADAEGLTAVFDRKRGGRASELSPRTVRRLEQLFVKKASISEAFAAVGAAGKSRATVGRVRKAWAARTKKAPSAAEEQPAAAAEPEAPAEVVGARLEPRQPSSVTSVQHLGTWLLIASVHQLGLHARALAIGGARLPAHGIRLALDASIAALGLGERCIEGVRRLATATAPTLLLAARSPTAEWTRRTLHRLAEEHLGAPLLHQAMTATYLARARADAEGEGPVFYVDNHLRPYTGKQVLRYGWRMQDKAVCPGVSDYYVHDEDGRVVHHVVAPEHGSLTDFLSPICERLRLGLGEDEDILVAFDRAGSFPTQLADLRDRGFEFVTYERRPYAVLAATAFTESVVVDDEKFLLHEARANLGSGRGRVRRIAVRTAEGHQLNLLATSKRPAKRLLEVMLGRWRQENGFKHANERWGINQLDGRRVTPFPEGTVIPNPARRRLDNALRLARVREGLLRNELARSAAENPKRPAVISELEAVLLEQQDLLELRPSMPSHAAIEETELANKLVHHAPQYKLLVDTIRGACLNAEADLALRLAPFLSKPREAKKVLANLFAASGQVHVSATRITVSLAPAGSSSEQDAMSAFLEAITELRLTLPGDQQSRPLRFQMAGVK